MKVIEIDVINKTVTEVEIAGDQEKIRDLIGEYNMAAMSVNWLSKYFTGIADHVMYNPR